MMEVTTIIEEFENFLHAQNIVVPLGAQSIEVDFSKLSKYNPEIANELLDNAEDTLRAFSIATARYNNDKEIPVRIKNPPNSQKILIREIRGEKHYNKLTQLEGRVKSKSKVRQKIVSARYECPACGNFLTVLILGDEVKEPKMCGCGRKGKFRLLSSDRTNVFVISLQEPEDLVKVGSDLQNITCLFTHDLCEYDKEQTIYQGCRIKLNGIIKDKFKINRDGSKNAVLDHFFEVNQVEEVEGDLNNMQITAEDIKIIKEYANKTDCIDILADNIFAPIYGHDDVKKAIILSMIGGTTFTEKHLKNRGLIHTLLIGDPAAGKSDIMLLAGKYHPKAMYINVAGGSATSVGLTSTVIKDELTGEWTFEAGAIPLMHRGMLCLHPDMHVYANGKMIRIKDIEQEKTIIINSLNDRARIIPSFASNISKRIYRGKILELIFEDGNSIKLTPEHKLLDDEFLWRESKSFRKGEYILSPSRLELFNEQPILIKDIIPQSWAYKKDGIYIRKQGKGESLKTDRITPQIAYILGFVRGDGHLKITPRHSSISIVQSHVHQAYIDRVKDYWNSFSHRPLGVYTKKFKPGWLVKNGSAHDILYSGSNLVAQISSWVTSNDLDNAFILPKEELIAFVSGMIDSDGCISIKHYHKGNREYCIIHFDLLISNSQETCRNICNLLKKLNIHATIKQKKSKVKSITVTGREDVERLINLTKNYSVKSANAKSPPKIRCVSSRKRRTAISRQNLHRIVTEIGNTKLRKHWMASPIYEKILHNTNIGREMFSKLLSENMSEELRQEMDKSINGEYYMNKIIEIREEEYSGEVYDLTIPNYHNYVAEGIIVHNCIDEIGELEEPQALQECLEQGSISVNKASIHATLLAETTVLAACNPKLGRFDPYVNVFEQINMPPQMISRFDLIYPFRDVLNEDKDQKIADTILSRHIKSRAPAEESKLTPDLVKKWIIMAQKIVPEMTDEVADFMKEKYVSIRNRNKKTKTEEERYKAVPISARQLQAMIRLSQALTKLQLRDKITKKNAEFAVNLVISSLELIGVDPETGEMDIQMIETGMPASKKNKIAHVTDIFYHMDKSASISFDDIAKAVGEHGISEGEVEEILAKLKIVGSIYEPKAGYWRRI